MDNESERENLLMQYKSYAMICNRAGLSVVLKDEQSLQKMSLDDLRQLVHEVRDIARTPRG